MVRGVKRVLTGIGRLLASERRGVRMLLRREAERVVSKHMLFQLLASFADAAAPAMHRQVLSIATSPRHVLPVARFEKGNR